MLCCAAHLTFESDRAKEFEVGLTRLRAEHEERTAHFATVLQQRVSLVMFL